MSKLRVSQGLEKSVKSDRIEPEFALVHRTDQMERVVKDNGGDRQAFQSHSIPFIEIDQHRNATPSRSSRCQLHAEARFARLTDPNISEIQG
jgi:hypothetical protein